LAIDRWEEEDDRRDRRVRERESAREWAARPGSTGPTERGERERACGLRARVLSGWAEWDGRGENIGSRPVVVDFVFFLSKNVNSNKFCLFCCELLKIPKMVKIIV
jgi:hypothetical protein